MITEQSLIVYDAHDFYQGILADGTGSPFQRHWILPFFRKIEKRCISRAHLTITVGKGVAEKLRTSYQCKPIVIRNAHDIRAESKPVSDIRQRMKLAPEDKLLVSVGNFKIGHAYPRITEILYRLPKTFKFAFVGANFNANILPQDLQSRVQIFLNIRAPEVVPFIRDADCAVLPYLATSQNNRFGLPNGLFQSLAAHLPCVYPPLEEITSTVESFDIGRCVEMSSIDMVAEAVRWIFSGDRYKGFQRNAKRFSDQCNWQYRGGIPRAFYK